MRAIRPSTEKAICLLQRVNSFAEYEYILVIGEYESSFLRTLVSSVLLKPTNFAFRTENYR